MTTLYDVVVKNRHVEGGNIAVMEFESATSATLPKVEAGAHIDVHLPNGMVRQYSLCQNPNDEGKFRLGILRDPESRGGSISAFDEIKDGIIYGDGLDRSKWERYCLANMKYNRAVIFDPKLWHSHGANFGDNLENGRLVQLFFFNNA